MDSAYLKSTVGSVLAKGIAETVVAKPSDPIDYLAQFLLKSVADEKEEKSLKTAQKAETERTQAAEAKAAAAKEAADATAEAVVVQKEKEDKRLASLLENATSTEEVFSAVLSYARARTGASGYVMLTDLPEKVMPYVPPPPPPPPAEGEEGYEEWKAAEEAKAAAAAEAEAAAAEGEEPPEPPPKFQPNSLEYVAATSSDEALLIGKATLQKPPPMPEEGSDEPPPPTGVGEGVSFSAIAEFYAGTSKVYHVPNAVTNRSVKFWYMPRIGAYACAPFADFEGDVYGCLGFDTLGLERPFTPEELELIASLAEQTGTCLQKIEAGLCQQHHEQVLALKELYPKSEEGAYPAPPAPEEGADPIETAKAAVALPQPILAGLTAEALKFTETRRRLLPALLLVLKGILALLSPAMAAELPAATWEGVKDGISTGELTWGADFFAAIGAFDVFAGSGEKDGASGWATAEAIMTELATAPEEGDGGEPRAALTAPETETVLGKLMYDWFAATVELHKLKAEKEAAEAAAAAEGGEAAEEAQE